MVCALTAAGLLSRSPLLISDSMPLRGPLVLNRLMPFASSSLVLLAAASRSASLCGDTPAAAPGVRLLALSRCRNASPLPPCDNDVTFRQCEHAACVNARQRFSSNTALWATEEYESIRGGGTCFLRSSLPEWHCQPEKPAAIIHSRCCWCWSLPEMCWLPGCPQWPLGPHP